MTEVEIIPTILVKEFAEVVARVSALQGLVEWAQIDVVDGKFAPNTTWNDPEQLASLDTPIRFEADLMVVDAAQEVDRWLKAAPRVGRIIVHQEVLGFQAGALLTRIHEAGVEAGLSINPATSYETLLPFADRLDAVLFLGVEPGFSGQHFDERVLQKVKMFHRQCPNIPIEVDGGIKVGIARTLAAAGVSRLAVGSAIFDFDEDPVRSELDALRHDANG